MKFSLRITLILFAVMCVLIALVFGYAKLLIDRHFSEQSEIQMQQNSSAIEQRIGLLQEKLESEMDQLISTVFTENETVLAAMLKNPPEFNTQVVGFARKLRLRTSLDFLTLISADGTILSSDPKQAIYGTRDGHPDFPSARVSYFDEGPVKMQLRRRAAFGQHSIEFEGGYLLKKELEKLPQAGVQLQIDDLLQGQSHPGLLALDPTYVVRTMTLNDYKGRPALQIQVAVSRKPLLEEQRRLILNLVWFILGSLAFCLLVGTVLSHSVSRPVTELKEAAQKLAAGDLSTRVDVHGSGEMASLMEAFNTMAERLEDQQQQLIRTERIAAWKEIAQHLAHEIKNPLTPIRTSITNLRLSREKAPEKFGDIFLESTESIMEEVEKLRHLADQFARFARLPAPVLKSGNLNEVIQKGLVLYQANPDIAIEFKHESIPNFQFDAEQISQVVHNLLQNATDAIEGKGTIVVATRMNDPNSVSLTIKDNGIGMAEEVKQQIFTPYFTTKTKGTGLGLAIVQRIVAEHGGSIVVDSSPSSGTLFDIRLPLRS